ncbi:hypothetical protein C8F01DRAFT_1126984 [Mycena amicta]|nr:hypothetical protein C8F01DRAFT_1126984 [Mycena amicta]
MSSTDHGRSALRPPEASASSSWNCSAQPIDSLPLLPKSPHELAVEKEVPAGQLRTLVHRPLILSLPAELTIEIFRLVPSSPLRLPNPSPVTVPLVFGEVCREWRRISRATPELWRSLIIILDSAIKQPGRWRSAVGKLVSGWVDRSEPFPIHLAFTQRPNAIFSTPPLIIGTFIRAASRLEEFRIEYLPLAARTEMFDTIYALLRLLTTRKLSVRSMPYHA